MIINDVSRFSNEQELADALQGKYAKDYQKSYQLTIVKNICFINTIGSCEVTGIPDHYKFKYTDDSGSHIVEAGINSIFVNGVASIFFPIKNG